MWTRKKRVIGFVVAILVYNQLGGIAYGRGYSTSLDAQFSSGSIATVGATMGLGIGVLGALGLFSHLSSSPDDEIPDNSKLIANSIFFSQPGTELLTVTNDSSDSASGDKKITINNVTLNSEIHGVTVGAISPTCSSILPHSSCTIPLTATQDAYGTGTATISYNKGKELTVAVQVAPTTLELYETTSGSETSISSNQDIILKPKGTSPTDITQTFKYKNSGKF
jgi:hypothetical protein